MTDDSTDGVRWLPTTGGRVTGWTGVAVAVLIAAVTLLRALPWWGLGVAVVLVWLAWTAMLRPRIGLTRDHLVLRGLVSTTTIPLGRINKVAVRQVFAVWVGDKRYVSAAAGHSRRQVLKPSKTGKGTMHEADVVEDAVRAQMAGSVGSAAEVTRTWAWLEIGLGVAAFAIFGILLFV